MLLGSLYHWSRQLKLPYFNNLNDINHQNDHIEIFFIAVKETGSVVKKQINGRTLDPGDFQNWSKHNFYWRNKVFYELCPVCWSIYGDRIFSNFSYKNVTLLKPPETKTFWAKNEEKKKIFITDEKPSGLYFKHWQANYKIHREDRSQSNLRMSLDGILLCHCEIANV